MSENHGQADPTYPWQRFWVPRDGSIDLSDGGFLRDPQSEFARYSPSKLDTLRDLQQFRALGLLGEPGIGKSATLEAEFKALQRQAQNDGRVYIHVDLRSFSSEVLLHRRVFEIAEFTAWEAGNSHLVLHLDSLDEALLRIDSVAALLADELPRHPTARMSIRIACRMAAWPHELLENALKAIWGEDAVGVFELAPLRRKDVIEAAAQRQIDPARFMEEIHKANAVPFAIKPLTLNLLFRIFQNSGRLPERITDLYSQGCLGLCEERSPSRRGARRVGQLNGHQRYRLASRIAAATMFANRYAIWMDPETAQRPDEDVPLSALSTGGETGDFQPFNASEDNLREVLDTGLFSSRGAARMGWAHQSYAEFLAADYLVTKQASADNILKILCHPSGGLVPQLSTVAAWVASRSETVRGTLIVQEPFALLRGDLLSWSQSDLAALTDALLTAFHEQRAHDFGFGIAHDYQKLAHPGLADQLRSYIIDPAKHVIARRAALMIARACSLRGLQAAILNVALNPADNASIRTHAVSAIGDSGDEDAKIRLLPLARGELGPDPNDEIKGRALQILWPNHLTSAELFQLITPPAQNFVGAYVTFLTTNLAKSLTGANLLPALQWATEYARTATHTDEFHIKELANGILMRAWEYIDQPDILCAFTAYVMLVMRRLHRIFLRDENNSFEGHIRENEAKRHQFLLAILSVRPKKELSDFSRLWYPRCVRTHGGHNMWTETTRPQYERKGLRYASDVTDTEWALIAPRLPPRHRRGRPRETELRNVVNALLYMARTACQWRQLPREFPPYATVQYYFYAWRDRGVLETINFELLLEAREAAGREASPSAGVIDSQSVKTTESGGPRGYDAAKKVKGRKRHIVTDTTGLMVGAAIHPADVQDRDGAALVIEAIHDLFPWLRHLFADSAYSGDKLLKELAKFGRWSIEIVKRMADNVGFEVLPRRWVVERTLAWLNRNRRLAKDFEASIASAKAWVYLASVQLLIRRLARS